MKILFISDNFPPETNAAATRVYERACYWVKWGHDVTIITGVPNFPHGRVFEGYENRFQTEVMDGMRIVRVKTYIAPNSGKLRRTIDFLSFRISALHAAKKELNPDIICATSPQPGAALAGLDAAKYHSIPFVFELGDLWPASISAVGVMGKSFLYRQMERQELAMYRKSDAIVALTGAFKKDLVRRNIDGDKIAVVINGVDTWRYGPQDRNLELATELGITDEFVVGYVGTHGMAHGLGNVLDAAEFVAQKNPKIRFLLAGAGAERGMLMSEAKRRGLSNVLFLPMQPKARMPEVWSLCNVALVHLRDDPTFAEVIPSKIFEAMAMGLPIIISAPRGEGSRIVERARAGCWTAAGDALGLAGATMMFEKDRESCQNFGAQSLAAAPGHSREKQARRMLGVYEEVIAGNAADVGII
jgi:colanic acid biosynthesis glycosyl transferase WcaI